MNNDGRTPKQTPLPLQPAPQKTPATDEQKQSTRSYLRIFVALVVAVLLTSGLALPWKLVPLALALAAVVVGILTLIKVVRYGIGAPQMFITSLGLAASAVMALGLGLAVATWDNTEKLENCMGRALTVQAQDECQSEFTNGLLPR
ncbi:hypothetical protein OL239_15710 [Arthrobacter sp. ATA002]|uniref:hypothetical protein n=1 Tax=Arthrobacter sp. ATA002 TaxID=2991715 RepID=UPI0022A7E64E|nr:hypothetical protein [Arthrobacter sp. ATA002]WAP51271.1 hypothetical protein OL239_15710 [Arthrobacter sp. ATA002]